MIKKLQYKPEFDALRAFAVLLVLFAHLPLIDGFEIWNSLKRLSVVLRFGYLGVDIFFVLSGFLITKILIDGDQKSFQKAIKNFFAKRFLRIFPIYYICITYCLILGMISIPEAKYNYLYLSNYFYSFVDTPSPLRHTWSLAVEEQFYIFWPFLVLLVPLKKLTKILIISSLALILFSFILVFEYFSDEVAEMLAVRAVFFRILSLATGSLIALNTGFFIRYSNTKTLLILALAIFPISQALLRYYNFEGSTIVLLFLFTGWSTSIFLLVLNSNSYKTNIQKLLQNRLIVYVGKFSYGLYLYHYIILHQMGIRHGYQVNGSTIQDLFMALFIIFSISILSFEIIEKPILKLKKKFN